MKLITAIVRAHKLESVKQALTSMGVQEITASEVKGFGRQKGHYEIYRGLEYFIEFIPKIKIEITTEDNQVEAITQQIINAARTDKIGDGKIFISNIEA